MYGGIPSVCKGAIEIMAESLLPAIGEGIFSSQRVCDEYLHVCASPKITHLSADEFVKKQLADKLENQRKYVKIEERKKIEPSH
mgnify:CR=1 FL=1